MEADTKSLEIRCASEPTASNASAVFGNVPLLGRWLPREAWVWQQGVQDKVAEYGVAFTPVTTLASQITIRVPAKGIERRLSWGELPGAEEGGVPENFAASRCI